MSKNLYKSLKKKLNGIDLEEIVDIFLFGSAVKGKEFPRDIDLCIIFRKKISNEIIKEIENKLKDVNIHLSSLNVDSFFRKPHSLIKTLLVEGISIFNGNSFIQNFGFSSYVLYSYSLLKLKPSEKVKFVYLLKGRDGDGIVKKFKGKWIIDGCFIMPIQKDSEILAIFEKWMIPYQRKEILIH